MIHEYTGDFEAEDIAKNRNLCILSYLGIFLIIPLFIRRNSPYVKFHSNQGLLLFIFATVIAFGRRILNAIFSHIIFLGVVSGFVFAVLSILAFALLVIGVLNTTSGRARGLPLLGTIRLLR